MKLTSPQLLLLTQLTDSMFPSGSFVYSDGLESYVQAGTIERIEQLEELLRSRLQCDWATQDLIALHTAMSAYAAGDMALVCRVDERLTVMKMAKESRLASRRIGRQTLKTFLTLVDDPFLWAYQERIQSQTGWGHQAVVFGLVAAHAAIDPQPALTTYTYSQLASQVSAALKLMRLGQTKAQQLLWNLQPAIAEAVAQALSHTVDEMQSFVPAWEIQAMRHEYLFRRLFNS